MIEQQVARVGKTLLPLPFDVINNLTKATPFKLGKPSYTKPFCYSQGFINMVAQYCLENETLYSADSFRNNLSFYLEAFSLNAVTKNLNQTKRYDKNNIFNDQDLLPKKSKQRVFFHGRSNGFPTPLGIRAFQLAGKLYPQSEIWFGVDHDKSLTSKSQLPFLNPQFRASCYLTPEIVDKIIYLHPPIEEAMKKDYWTKIYSSDESLQPDIIVIPDDELNGIKKGDSNGQIKVLSFSDIFSFNEYALFSKIHQTNLKNGDISLEELKLAWKIIIN